MVEAQALWKRQEAEAVLGSRGQERDDYTQARHVEVIRVRKAGRGSKHTPSGKIHTHLTSESLTPGTILLLQSTHFVPAPFLSLMFKEMQSQKCNIRFFIIYFSLHYFTTTAQLKRPSLWGDWFTTGVFLCSALNKDRSADKDSQGVNKEVMSVV